MRHVIIIGASGHGKVIADIIEKSGDKIIGFLDDDHNLSSVFGYPVLGNLGSYQKYKKDNYFIIAIGNNKLRKEIAEKLNDAHWHTAIHPSAIMAKDVVIGDGTVVMANVVINASAKIGKHVILNTASIVEHDNVIGDYTHLSPRVALGGTVKIGTCSHIGIGACIKNNTRIADNVVVGAGACVVRDITEQGTYIGVPVKKIK